jgi:F-box/leucine-rich repeat protein 7
MRRQPLRSSSTATQKPSDPYTLLQSFDSGVNPSRPVKSSPLGSSTIAGLPLELLDRLKAFPLFQSAPDSFLLSIGKSLRPSVFQPSQEVIKEGDDAKAMYWLVRGSVKVTSIDGESTYAELKPGSFFGEIGILMDIPRTASIVATVRSLLVRLNKEDLQKELPKYPAVENAIREEASERLAILERKKKELGGSGHQANAQPPVAARKRSSDWLAGDVEMVEVGSLANGEILSHKRRKSPSPGIAEVAASSALGSGPHTVRQLLKELPLFSALPGDILHFLGVNAQPVSYPPFTEIIEQGSSGRDVYFIVKGDVEVLTQAPDSRRNSTQQDGAKLRKLDHPSHEESQRQRVRARLHTGQYFGEVTSLSLSPMRTATVRSVEAVECLLINGEVLDELWRKCSSDLRQQVEDEAKRRMDAAKKDDDAFMADIGAQGPIGSGGATTEPVKDDADDWRKSLPVVRFEEPDDMPPPPNPPMEPMDPDPFFNGNLDNIRARSRRSSLAPPQPVAEAPPVSLLESIRTPSPPNTWLSASSPLRPKSAGSADSLTSPLRLSPTATRRPSMVRVTSNIGKGRLPDPILTKVFQELDLLDLMKLRLVSMHWHNLLTTSPDILHRLDLSKHNRRVTDDVLRDIIVPFAGSRPKDVDLSNCYHVTDEGFASLVDACGDGARMWKMKSVWDVSAPAVLSFVEKAKCLEEIDLSNCRKVGDNLLARVVGWVVPKDSPQQKPLPPPPTNTKRPSKRNPSSLKTILNNEPPPAPGSVIGAPKLKRLTLSYCKHVQDRSMAHIAHHAADRLESLDLTRCTSISDAGFHSWGVYEFKNLQRLVLADCTYLSDQAIVGIVGGCRTLRELDLSFCCALSDTATEVLALGLPHLQRLNMAFCGSAVSDNSLRCIGLHLLELRYISVRGCVRVTGHGVESLVDGCQQIEEIDVSQCKNLRPWLERGGVGRVTAPKPNGMGRRIVFDTVADGTWRGGR